MVKIKETIERDCCQSKDLKTCHTQMKPAPGGKGTVTFCTHCGQLWIWDRLPGDMDSNHHRVLITGWKTEGRSV